MSASPAEHPAVAAVTWAASALGDPSALTVADLEVRISTAEWDGQWSLDQELDFFRNGRHAASRPLTLESVSVGGPLEASATLVGADAKRWCVTCWVEDTAPHRIVRARTMPAPPEGLTIRVARPDDGPTLGELERRAPLRLGHEPLTLMTFDHGDDYFAPSRLMAEVTIYVAEVEGVVAGVYCGAVQPVGVEGTEKRLFLEHHVRIDPATARGGVFWALCMYGRDRYARTTDSIAFYVSVDNHPVRKFVENVPPWSVRPLRALLPCPPTEGRDPRAGSTSVDLARPEDAGTVARIINRGNEGAGLFLPYTEASLAARLARDPDQYGWADVMVSDGAVVGAGRRLLTVKKERAGSVEVTRRALVLDHGFEPGHEQEYRHLLEQACAAAGRAGATHLAVFTSAPSPTHDVVMDLAETIEPFDFWAFDLPEPPSLVSRGFYVDPVYF